MRIAIVAITFLLLLVFGPLYLPVLCRWLQDWKAQRRCKFTQINDQVGDGGRS